MPGPSGCTLSSTLLLSLTKNAYHLRYVSFGCHYTSMTAFALAQWDMTLSFREALARAEALIDQVREIRRGRKGGGPGGGGGGSAPNIQVSHGDSILKIPKEVS